MQGVRSRAYLIGRFFSRMLEIQPTARSRLDAPRTSKDGGLRALREWNSVVQSEGIPRFRVFTGARSSTISNTLRPLELPHSSRSHVGEVDVRRPSDSSCVRVPRYVESGSDSVIGPTAWVPTPPRETHNDD
jgi:hypothetical protein